MLFAPRLRGTGSASRARALGWEEVGEGCFRGSPRGARTPCPGGSSGKNPGPAQSEPARGAFQSPPASRVSLASCPPRAPLLAQTPSASAADASSPSGRLARPCEELGTRGRSVPSDRRLPRRSRARGTPGREPPSPRRASNRLSRPRLARRLPGPPGEGVRVGREGVCVVVSSHRWTRTGSPPTPRRQTAPTEHGYPAQCAWP